jgi:release factor glutamine methyltransferase
MTISEWLTSSMQKLQKAGIKTARLDALLLLEFVTQKNRAWLLANPGATLSLRSYKQCSTLIDKRIQRIPIAYLTGYKEFYGMNFKVTKDVLIPRPESEALVDLAVKLTPKNGKLIDVGTGSGALAIAIAKHRPDLKITATDISASALKMAKQNAKLNFVDHVATKPLAKSHRIIYLHTNLLQGIDGKFDVVVANLPYLPKIQSPQPEILYEPRAALYGGGKDGLEIYGRLFSQVSQNLKLNGLVIIEAEPNQHNQLNKLAERYKLALKASYGLCKSYMLKNY